MKERVKKAIAKRLMTEPALYGKPLRATLKGYWKLRVGDYRVVYSVQDSEVADLRGSPSKRDLSVGIRKIKSFDSA